MVPRHEVGCNGFERVYGVDSAIYNRNLKAKVLVIFALEGSLHNYVDYMVTSSISSWKVLNSLSNTHKVPP